MIYLQEEVVVVELAVAELALEAGEEGEEEEVPQ